MSSTDQNPSPSKSVFLKQETLHKEKWLSLERVTYQDPRGKERTWEVVERTTKPKIEGVSDCVAMIAILNRLLHYDCIVLIKQFRPPFKAYTIEFPAGLVDPNESQEEAALRELKEETGYTGTVLAVSPCTALDPGISSASCSFVHVQIDGNDNANDSAVACPEDGEFIEILLIPVNELLHRLQEMAKQKDVVIDSNVYMYASTLTHPHLGMVPSTIINSD
eukprot:XP_011668955.1 PREDICTED: ADP-sugar pyrophosphatase [Strongylocentrotus purpuratus]